LNIIDTPGLFELKPKDESDFLKRKNEEILKLIDECLDRELTKMNLICFVFNLKNGINDNDIEAMILFKNYYNLEINKYCLLVITNCEDIDGNERDRLFLEFLKHPKIVQNDIKNLFGLGCLFLGCLNRNDYDNSNEQSIYRQFMNVIDMRNTFILKIIECQNSFNIKDKHKSGCNII